MECKIMVHRFSESDVDIPVFTLELSEEGEEGSDTDGIWCETFGSLELLNAFLRGVRAGNTFPSTDALMNIPRGGFRELPGGWNLHSAPFLLWPEKRI